MLVLENTTEANVDLGACPAFVHIVSQRVPQYRCGLCNLAVFQMVPSSNLGSAGQLGWRSSVLREDEESSLCPLVPWLKKGQRYIVVWW